MISGVICTIENLFSFQKRKQSGRQMKKKRNCPYYFLVCMFALRLSIVTHKLQIHVLGCTCSSHSGLCFWILGGVQVMALQVLSAVVLLNWRCPTVTTPTLGLYNYMHVSSHLHTCAYCSCMNFASCFTGALIYFTLIWFTFK